MYSLHQVASSWHPVLNRFDNILAAPCLDIKLHEVQGW